MVKFVHPGALLMASLEGHMLGQYKVIAQMGSGGMATVYQAYHPRLDRTVAIKMLHEAFQEDKNFLARFEREAQIVARLEHPHIVPVFDFDEYNGRPYLVMKYIEGHTLKAEIESHSLTMDEILRLLPPIASALDYAHRQGVLHRDVKPSNIILDNDGVPYVTDFGLARMAQLGDSTLSHDALLGTPHYISPEQAMGNSDLDSRTDLYSFGIVLYELVVGRVPFSADTPFAIIHDQIYRPLPKPSTINPEISPAVDAVLEKALAKNPAERYATATALVDAFRSAATQSGLNTLNPDRSSVASQSLAKVRSEQNRLSPSASFPLDDEDEAPSIPAPRAAEPEEDSPEWWGRGMNNSQPPRRPSFQTPPTPPGFQTPPTPPEYREKRKHVVEASFDLSNAGKALKEAGNVVREVFEEISSQTINLEKDIDLAAMDDEAAIRKRVEKQLNTRKEFSMHLVVFGLVNVLIWLIFGMVNSGEGGIAAVFNGAFPWALIVTLGWGAGLMAHAVETYYTTGQRARARLQAIHDEFYRLYGENWHRTNRKELRKVRDRVNGELSKKREWFEHLAVFIPINVMLWSIFLATGGDYFPFPVIVTLAWGAGLLAHGIEYRSQDEKARENAISRAVEQERDWLYNGEKPKRDQSFLQSRRDRDAEIRLTEDGELTDSMVQQFEDEAKPRRRR